ncbi:MAG: cytochrome b/b6 domain-containing protein [Nitrososphaerota archaeon]|nr:cytochrome b/b6 domain-containing protein [Nitrososphaerota archaeon]
MFGAVLLSTVPLTRLPVVYGAIIVLLFVAMVVVHWSRRSFREPEKPSSARPGESEEGMIRAFDVVERVYHWALFIVMGLLIITGLSLIFPSTFTFLMASFGVTNAIGLDYVHTTMVWALLVLMAVHIVWDLAIKRGWWNIWIGRKDIKDLPLRAANFFGATKKYAKGGKYDIFMKTLHWGMALSLTALGITGLYMWNPFGLIGTINPGIDSLFRQLHDIFAYLFVGIIIGHIYFGVLPVNWPILRAIFTGNISKKTYDEEYNPERWKLVEKSKKEEPKEKAPQAHVPLTRATESATQLKPEVALEKGALECV